MTNHPNRNRKATAAASAPSRRHDHARDYALLLSAFSKGFESAIEGQTCIFMTDAKGLNDLYLDSLPAERQVHNCAACRRFIEHYGGLVTIDDLGVTRSIMWSVHDPILPQFYYETFSLMAARVRRAKVTGPFYTKESVWGLPRTGEWSHMAARVPKILVHQERALTAGQKMAAARESFKTVAMALAQFTTKMLDTAINLLEADSLARSEKFEAPVRWLRELKNRPPGRKGENVLWAAVASAPEGYLHPKASMIGPLLEDIAAGLSFDEIKRRFDAKMHPLKYQRPQAPPAAGNIKAAEALFEKLGLAPALERRFARLDEIRTRWMPARPKAQSRVPGSVFGHIKAKDDHGVGKHGQMPPSQVMTWEKFARVVLPMAEQIELNVPIRGAFIAMTTAVHSDAPPILKWDYDDARNPVAWYCYHNNTPATQWGLAAGWTKVTAVSSLPTMWGSRATDYLHEGMILILEGAMDTLNAGNSIFPECLKNELHGMRATIEAYSRNARLSGKEDGSACGYDLRKGTGPCTADLRVLSNGSWLQYKIDRWD